jgi:hypothetical protein
VDVIALHQGIGKLLERVKDRRIVNPDHLQVLAIPLPPHIHRAKPVVGAVLLANAHEAQLDHTRLS